MVSTYRRHSKALFGPSSASDVFTESYSRSNVALDFEESASALEVRNPVTITWEHIAVYVKAEKAWTDILPQDIQAVFTETPRDHSHDLEHAAGTPDASDRVNEADSRGGGSVQNGSVSTSTQSLGVSSNTQPLSPGQASNNAVLGAYPKSGQENKKYIVNNAGQEQHILNNVAGQVTTNIAQGKVNSNSVVTSANITEGKLAQGNVARGQMLTALSSGSSDEAFNDSKCTGTSEQNNSSNAGAGCKTGDGREVNDGKSGSNGDLGKSQENQHARNTVVRLEDETTTDSPATTASKRKVDLQRNVSQLTERFEMEDVLLQTLESFRKESKNGFSPSTIDSLLTNSFHVTWKLSNDELKSCFQRDETKVCIEEDAAGSCRKQDAVTNISEQQTLVKRPRRRHKCKLNRSYNAKEVDTIREVDTTQSEEMSRELDVADTQSGGTDIRSISSAGARRKVGDPVSTETSIAVSAATREVVSVLGRENISPVGRPSTNIDEAGRTLLNQMGYHWPRTESQSFTKPPGFKQVLFRMTGYCRPGCLLGILGASGSGKSTLLNVLTGRNLKDVIVRGRVMINGLNLGSRIRDISAYVQQNDLFIGTLTVRETLMFRAKLKLSREDTVGRVRLVDELLRVMGLGKVADTKIGQPGTQTGISRGEAKRLSFACEMVTNPPLIFCDEPTTGLDTFMAYKTVEVLKYLADLNHTVICSIHQPSSQVFALFDEILLLAEGRMAFMGTPDQCTVFLAELGAVCPPGYNPADFYICTLAVVPGEEIKSRHNVHMVCQAFEKTAMGASIRYLVREMKIKDNEREIRQDLLSATEKRQPKWCQQFTTVLLRSWRSLIREKILCRVRFVNAIVMSIVLGLIFLRLDYDQKGVMDINGALFMTLTFTNFPFLFGVLHFFAKELPVFGRDYGSRLYRIDVFYLAKTFAELPVNILLPVICGSIDYVMMGLYPGWKHYLIAICVLVMTSNIAAGLGHLIACACQDLSISIAVANPVVLPLILMSGYLLNDENIPVYLVWLKFFSWFRFGNELLVVNQWREVTSLTCPEADNANTTEEDYDCPTNCRFADGAAVLDFFTFSADNDAFNWGMLTFLLVFYRVAAHLALLMRTQAAAL